jgi:hypothetical protein
MLRFLENRTKPLVSELPCSGPGGGNGVCVASVCVASLRTGSAWRGRSGSVT